MLCRLPKLPTAVHGPHSGGDKRGDELCGWSPPIQHGWWRIQALDWLIEVQATLEACYYGSSHSTQTGYFQDLEIIYFMWARFLNSSLYFGRCQREVVTLPLTTLSVKWRHLVTWSLSCFLGWRASVFITPDSNDSEQLIEACRDLSAGLSGGSFCIFSLCQPVGQSRDCMLPWFWGNWPMLRETETVGIKMYESQKAGKRSKPER